jgi:hypothetical protein
MRTLKENTEQIQEHLELLNQVNCRQTLLEVLRKLEELYNERTVLLSQMDRNDGGWHEAYSAGVDNTYKLMIKVLEKI